MRRSRLALARGKILSTSQPLNLSRPPPTVPTVPGGALAGVAPVERGPVVVGPPLTSAAAGGGAGAERVGDDEAGGGPAGWRLAFVRQS